LNPDWRAGYLAGRAGSARSAAGDQRRRRLARRLRDRTTTWEASMTVFAERWMTSGPTSSPLVSLQCPHPSARQATKDRDKEQRMRVGPSMDGLPGTAKRLSHAVDLDCDPHVRASRTTNATTNGAARRGAVEGADVPTRCATQCNAASATARSPFLPPGSFYGRTPP
jgi:hypothetical protein